MVVFGDGAMVPGAAPALIVPLHLLMQRTRFK